MSLEEIQKMKNGGVTKHSAHEEEAKGKISVALFIIIVFAVVFTVIACHFLIQRYCKGRGVSEANIVEPRRIDREYTS